MTDRHRPPKIAPEAPGWANETTLLLLVLLLCTDGAFVLLHVIYVETRLLRGADFSLEADGGWPETYQYVKQFWIVLAMTVTCWRTRISMYGCWAVVFAFLLLDDAAQIHEQMGAWLGREYSLPTAFGLRSDDIGELMFAAAAGLIMIVLVGVASLRVGEARRRVSRDMLCLVVALAFAGVVIDTLHVIAYFEGSLLAQWLLLLEDGGEMLVMSALTAYTFQVAAQQGRTRLYLWGSLRAWLLRSPRGHVIGRRAAAAE